MKFVGCFGDLELKILHSRVEILFRAQKRSLDIYKYISHLPKLVNDVTDMVDIIHRETKV